MNKYTGKNSFEKRKLKIMKEDREENQEQEKM